MITMNKNKFVADDHVFDYDTAHSFRLNYGNIIPTNASVFVSYLASLRNHDQIHIGGNLFITTFNEAQ